MKVFGNQLSGNCLKVKYTADRLGVPYTWVDVDLMNGETRTAEFLALNPAGQVPVLQFENGTHLAQSNAIIRFLARGTALLPVDPYEQAKVDEWLFWEQYSHEPYVAVCRFHMFFLGRSKEARQPERVKGGEAALDLMEHTLAGRDWFVGRTATIADIALVAYTRLSHEGGFDLSQRPRIRGWIARCESTLGLKTAQAA
jgi:glutathione S-transferase